MDKTNLKFFGQQFINAIKGLIEKEIEKNKNTSNHSDFMQHIIQHAKTCLNLTSKMDYNNNQYSEIEKYILDESNNSPFVITGASGAGLFSILRVPVNIQKLFKISFKANFANRNRKHMRLLTLKYALIYGIYISAFFYVNT